MNIPSLMVRMQSFARKTGEYQSYSDENEDQHLPLKPSSIPHASLVQSLLKATDRTLGSAESLIGRRISMMFGSCFVERTVQLL